MKTSSRAYLPGLGDETEKRPGLDAVVARMVCFFVLFLVASFYLPNPPSILGAVLVAGTKLGFGVTWAYNVMRWVILRSLTYHLDPTGVAIRLGLWTLHLSYAKITAAERRDTRWEIVKGGPLTYAKEVPQLIEYVAQIGPFIVDGRQKVYLYSTLSSYHHPTGLILFTTKDGKQYGISPAEPERFLADLEERRKQVQ